MNIVSFHVSEDHMVTIDIERMPRQSSTENTLVDIGGVTQNRPESVSSRAGKVVFNAGAAEQEGLITVRVDDDGTPYAAVSDEMYKTLKLDPENGDKSALSTIYPRHAKAGEMITIRGRNLDMLIDLYVGYFKIPSFRHTKTSATFMIPPAVTPDSYAIRFKDKFMGAIGNSTLRLEVTGGAA